MELVVEYRQIDDLTPYENNSRLHSEQQIREIADSIAEFGFTNPVLIDDKNGIIAGHCRVDAAKLLNMTTVPTIVLGELTETQKRAYVIADNKHALNAEWNQHTLIKELMEIREADFDLSLIGFNEIELKDLLRLDDDDDEKTGSRLMDEERNLLLVECESQVELQNLFDELKEQGYEVKIMS